MLFFKKKSPASEEELLRFIRRLEDAYMEQDEIKLNACFHPDQRGMSFARHVQLQMNFQIYQITSQILHFEIVESSEEEAVFAYTRKHLYTCKNPGDEPTSSLNNITSYYVKVVREKRGFWITKYTPYSVLYLDRSGETLPGEAAVVPPNTQFFGRIRPLLACFQLDGLKPATYHTYSDSEFIGYFPENEIFCYRTTEKFSVDFFETMDAADIREHTEVYLDQELDFGEALEVGVSHSIIETRTPGSQGTNHELVLSLLTREGLFMVRYMKMGDPIPNEARSRWIEQMQEAVKALQN
ncbi:hypothetical protein [Paenibacillus sanfengchensis]|uniref:hypothetical protein n=1 Tax=Paenibacillus sanfengchensis TaxID=3119819 RepID=UPI002FDF780F